MDDATEDSIGDSTGGSLGVAVIGYAFMGKAHSNAWRNVGAFHPRVPTIRQEVLVGRDPAQVATAASRYGWSRAVTDWQAVIEDDSVDIVDICVPGHLHAEIAIAALAAGKHVLVEKPLANTIPEAEAMVAAAQDAGSRGVRAMVGFNYRRVPALAMARDLIAGGRLGTVRQARVSYLQDWLVDAAAPMTWRMRKEAAGSGALGDLGSHAVDQVRYLLGAEVASVSGLLETFVGERSGTDGLEAVTVDDAAWATLRTTTGAVASIEVSRMATGQKNALTIEVYGSLGSLRFSLESLNELHVCLDGSPGFTRVLATEAHHPYVEAWWPPGHVLGWDSTFTNQAADLLGAIAAGTEPSPSFADGLAVQRVLAAIEDSAARSGSPVSLEESS